MQRGNFMQAVPYRRRTVWVALAMVTLGALALVIPAMGQSPEAVEPPQIVYGETRCANYPCKMFIKQPEHAASLVADDGSFAFCDIGCLLVYMKNNYPDGERVQAAFVRDWPSQAWTEARRATYVRTPDIRTPMRYGVVAFADAHAAAEFARDKGGEVLSLREATHYVVTERARRMGSTAPSH